MDRMLYVAMTGAKETMLAQGIHSNNLANANTTGFRSDFEQFRSMPVFGPGHPTRVYAMTENPGTNFGGGPIITTGRQLDIAVKDEGMIAVQRADGTEGYTRAGDLRVAPGGFLTTGTGHLVLGDNGPISLPDYEELEIGTDGTISMRAIGQQANALAVVDRVKLVNPPLSELDKGKDGLLYMKNGAQLDGDARVNVVSGALEGSNVNSINEMVSMLSLTRQYELQVKMMKTAQEVDSSSTQLLKMS